MQVNIAGLVHDREHIERVVLEGRCGEWSGPPRDLGHLALRTAGGALLAVEALQRGDALTALHFTGAKHHAQQGWSSGFAVLSARQRLMLMLAAAETSNEEIATMLGYASSDSVKTTIARLRKSIREQFGTDIERLFREW